jgi:putative FMN-dependent luciferase-like monooxygenase
MTRTIAKPTLRLGFFTRLLDQADAAERYRLATAQIMHAERCGFDSAWVAQHHFHEDEGGLPAPFVFLSQIAARTTCIRLGTGIVTLPLELPVRVAEDAAVLDLMCGGRLEVGIGPGGNLSAYEAFGLDSTERTALLVRHHRVLVDAWSGRALPGGDRVYPPNPGLADRIWQATFNIEGARRAGAAGDGLMLSRTQPRPAGKSHLSLPDIQNPMIDAYLASLAPERAPRILASRTVFVADDRAEALRLAEIGLARQRVRYAAIGRPVFVDGMSVHDQIAAMDIHIGDPDDVIGSLRADTVLARATDLTVQSHSIDPPHPFILRSIELVAEVVAPALGWTRTGAAAARHGCFESTRRRTMSAALRDVMDALAGIKPGSALDAVRNRRPQAREQAEASFRALFEPESFAGVSATERFALAVFVTGLHGDAVSTAFYAERLAATGPPPVKALMAATLPGR